MPTCLCSLPCAPQPVCSRTKALGCHICHPAARGPHGSFQNFPRVGALRPPLAWRSHWTCPSTPAHAPDPCAQTERTQAAGAGDPRGPPRREVTTSWPLPARRGPAQAGQRGSQWKDTAERKGGASQGAILKQNTVTPGLVGHVQTQQRGGRRSCPPPPSEHRPGSACAPAGGCKAKGAAALICWWARERRVTPGGPAALPH